MYCIINVHEITLCATKESRKQGIERCDMRHLDQVRKAYKKHIFICIIVAGL